MKLCLITLNVIAFGLTLQTNPESVSIKRDGSVTVIHRLASRFISYPSFQQIPV
jgi:hypothetical protein